MSDEPKITTTGYVTIPVNKTKWYEESPGVVSSKRIFGGGMASAGLAMKLALFVWALFSQVGDAATASAQADGLLLAGTTLLGITGVADLFKKSGV